MPSAKLQPFTPRAGSGSAPTVGTSTVSVDVPTGVGSVAVDNRGTTDVMVAFDAIPSLTNDLAVPAGGVWVLSIPYGGAIQLGLIRASGSDVVRVMFGEGF